MFVLIALICSGPIGSAASAGTRLAGALDWSSRKSFGSALLDYGVRTWSPGTARQERRSDRQPVTCKFVCSGVTAVGFVLLPCIVRARRSRRVLRRWVPIHRLLPSRQSQRLDRGGDQCDRHVLDDVDDHARQALPSPRDDREFAVGFPRSSAAPRCFPLARDDLSWPAQHAEVIVNPAARRSRTPHKHYTLTVMLVVAIIRSVRAPLHGGRAVPVQREGQARPAH
jgi:hypothetical protein